MKKITATILSLLALTTVATAPLGGVSKQTPPATAAATPPAELPFSSLTDVAVSEDYTAVIGGNALYLFDHKKGGFWQTYTHESAILQAAIDGQGTLYLRDSEWIYALHADAWASNSTPEKVTDKFDTFFLNGNDLYLEKVKYGDGVTQLQSYATEETYTFQAVYTDFFLYNGNPYAINAANELYELTFTAGGSEIRRASFAGTRKCPALLGDTLYTVGEGNLYAYDLVDGSETTVDTGNYTALSTHGDLLYTINGGKPYALTTQNGDPVGTPIQAAGVFTLPVHEITTSDLQADGTAQAPLVTTKPNALLAKVSFTAVGDTLSLNDTARRDSLVGLKLGKTAGYTLLAYWDTQTKTYLHYLVADCGIEGEREGFTPTAEETPATRYTTNEIELYKLPYMQTMQGRKIPKGSEITLLGEVNDLDRPYYKISFDGEIGYIPKAYTVDFQGNRDETAETVVSDGNNDKDSIWRMAYVLLGFVAIGILVDYLILRKKNED